MYNSEKPSPEELPSSAQLIKSTIIAAVAAVVLLVTVVLPAEYGIDPTRIGSVLGLTEMGEIKTDLAEEAARDAQQAPEDQSSLFKDIFGAFVGAAYAQQSAEPWADEFSFTLTPGEGIEWKLVMDEGAVTEFDWVAEGGRANFELHGDNADESISYEKGRGKTGAKGTLVAAFTGNHGWFWRNRDKQDITITVKLRGAYSDIKRTY
ncbi:transmembrane anchor protein (plasmid) [Ruegeria sp. SCSIO 43209]|uniref:transmembrane anchor protein n=1 Tax=Ruegeria sp. SCSIO 43209 TaxID=2793010 RepID=UPI001479EEBF|nr:transmembrane anchor protein [Ruegeria sp. SCSIO 43209]UAB91476.1 transmembrane anchor protein [Ruegeria sp. SCSIO 43209]